MDENAEPTPLERLERLASSVSAARRDLESHAENLSVAEIGERALILQNARETARTLSQQLGDAVGAERERVERYESDIASASLWAHTLRDRRAHWESQVVPHLDAITRADEEVQVLHNDLKAHRRERTAAEVLAMKVRVEELQRDCLLSYTLLKEAELHPDLRRRMGQKLDRITRALHDATQSHDRKAQWEAGLATNAAAVEALVSELEALAASGAEAGDVRRRVRHIAREIDRRRPMDPAARAAFEARTTAVAQDAAQEIASEREARRTQLTSLRRRIDQMMDELAERLNVHAPATPAPVDAASEDDTTDAHDAPPESPADTPAPASAPALVLPPLTIPEMEHVLNVERELGRLMTDGSLGHGERRRHLSRARALSPALEAVRAKLNHARVDEVASKVRAAVEHAQHGPVDGVLRHIQEVQKMVGLARLPKKAEGALRKDLRDAWTTATARIEAQKQARNDQKLEGMRKLANHYERWQHRIGGLEGLIARLEEDLLDARDRAQGSMSLGFRIAAEQFRARTTARLAELRATRDELAQRVADVEPRLRASGYPWPRHDDPVPASPEAPAAAAHTPHDEDLHHGAAEVADETVDLHAELVALHDDADLPSMDHDGDV